MYDDHRIPGPRRHRPPQMVVVALRHDWQADRRQLDEVLALCCLQSLELSVAGVQQLENEIIRNQMPTFDTFPTAPVCSTEKKKYTSTDTTPIRMMNRLSPSMLRVSGWSVGSICFRMKADMYAGIVNPAPMPKKNPKAMRLVQPKRVLNRANIRMPRPVGTSTSQLLLSDPPSSNSLLIFPHLPWGGGVPAMTTGVCTISTRCLGRAAGRSQLQNPSLAVGGSGRTTMMYLGSTLTT